MGHYSDLYEEENEAYNKKLKVDKRERIKEMMTDMDLAQLNVLFSVAHDINAFLQVFRAIKNV